MDITLDKNGKISDTDKLYNRLDELEENEKYDDMGRLIFEVPRGQWSLKLHFLLISVCLNVGNYPAATIELRNVFPSCEEKSDVAQFYYYSGYAEANLAKNNILGLSLFKQALAADPGDELGLDIEQECRECAAEIDRQIQDLRGQCSKAALTVRALCREANAVRELGWREFALELEFLSTFKTPPVRMEKGDVKPLGQTDLYEKFSEEDKPAIAAWLKAVFGITDFPSLLKNMNENRGFNLNPLTIDIACHLAGHPRFDIEILDESGREAFELFSKPISCFADLLPGGGVMAYDIGKKIAILRFAFGADIIGKDDFTKAAEELSRLAADCFENAEEFLTSLLFGSALGTFDGTSGNLTVAANALEITLKEISRCGLPSVQWQIDG